MAKRLLVEILGESKQFVGELGKAEEATTRFGSTVGKLSGVAKVAGLAIVGGIAVGLTKSVAAALDAQKSTARLDQAFRNVGLTASQYGKQIGQAETSSEKLGFVSSDVRDAMGSLITATGSVSKSTRDLSVAQDLARFKSVSLVDATKMMTMAMTGSQRAAKQLGITVIPVTTNLDALKASHVNLATAAGKAEEAHAKLLDKMATGNAVIDAVNAKVHGQAQAFSDTAAGGMARFHAALVDLEEKVGTALLPALTKVTDALARFVTFLSNSPGVAAAASAAMKVFGDVMHTLTVAGELLLGWYQRHQTAAKAIIAVLAAVAIAFASPVVAIAAVGVALIELYNRSKTFRDGVNAAFDAVRNKVNQVMPTIKAIITGVVTAAEALWKTFGSTLISVATTAGNAVIKILRDMASIVGSVFTLIGDLIHGRWGKVWDDLKNIVSKAFDAVKTALVAEITIIGTIGVKIGEELINGVKNGIESAAQGVYDAAKNFVDKAKKTLEFWHSPPGDYGKWIGSEIGLGVIEGWLTSSAALPAKLSQTIRAAVQAGQQVIQAAQSQFQQSFGALASIADNAFSSIAGSAQTKTEKQIAKMQAAHDKAQAAAQLQAANQAIADAKQAISDYQLGIAVNGTSAIDMTKEAQLTQQLSDAEKARDEVLYQQKLAAMQKKAAKERQELDAQNAVRQLDFDKQLQALENHLSKTGASAAKSQEAILALFAKYGIKFASVGRDMGIAWVAALKAAIAEAAGASGDIGSAIDRIARGIQIPQHKATGGPVTAGTPYIVGERGQELFVPASNGTIIPNGAGGGGVNITINAGAFVHEQQVGDYIVRVLQKRAASQPAGTPFRVF